MPRSSMADSRNLQSNGEPLFVSPERLVLDNDMNALQRVDVQQQQAHHQHHHAVCTRIISLADYRARS